MTTPTVRRKPLPFMGGDHLTGPTVQDADEDGLPDKLELNRPIERAERRSPAQYPRHGSCSRWRRPQRIHQGSLRGSRLHDAALTTSWAGRAPWRPIPICLTPAALKLIGDALWCAGVVPCDASALNPSNRVRVHFDVGTAYPGLFGRRPDLRLRRALHHSTAQAWPRGRAHSRIDLRTSTGLPVPGVSGHGELEDGFDLIGMRRLASMAKHLTHRRRKPTQRAACLDRGLRR